MDLSTYTRSGKITIVSFWNTQGPCKKNWMPMHRIMRIGQKYEAQLLAISIDDIRGQRRLNRWSLEKWQYIVLVDSNSDLQRQLGFNSIPQLYMLDQKGTSSIRQADMYLVAKKNWKPNGQLKMMILRS
ncbi:MAG: redoxin domain-containing protein [Saprospiraceae bacterium]|nr:redoxin domain-containing protein [Saprospiraceae bacterium]